MSATAHHTWLRDGVRWRSASPPALAAMVGVCVALSACSDAGTSAHRGPTPTASVQGTAASAASPDAPASSASAATSPKLDERDLRALLGDGARIDELPLGDTDPGRDFEPDLEHALVAGGRIEIAAGSDERLARAAREHTAALVHCYRRGLLMNPTLRGEARWSTSVEGERAAPPSSIVGDVPDASVLACLRAELHRAMGWPVPAPGEEATSRGASEPPRLVLRFEPSLR